MTKVLITGGAGFIGSHIADKLICNGYEVIIVDDFSSGKMSNLVENSNIQIFNESILSGNLDKIFEKTKPEYCIHLAAQTSVNYSISMPFEDAELNILASVKLLEICKKYNIKKFIAASSAAVYGIPQYLPIDEEHQTEPILQYGLSKLSMEKYIKLSGVPYLIFRFSNAYGPRQSSSKESGVIAIFDRAMKNNEKINIYGDGSQIRDFIYVEDIAQICVRAIKTNVSNEVINFSTNNGVTLNKLFKVMSTLYTYSKSVNYCHKRDGDIKDSILSNKKALEIFGDIKYTPLLEGLKRLKEYSLCKIN